MRSDIIRIVLILLLAPALIVQGQSQRSRRVVKSFKAFENTSVQVVNKYGNVHLVPWEKDSVRLEVQLNISGSKDPRGPHLQ
ncbi:MAG TPA: hypothetical protein P5248_09915 [Bacteroidales bacterium]|nr:hypothetical protein [Bacteroidales bacterium]